MARGSAFQRFWLAGTVSQIGAGVGAAAFPLLAASLSTRPTHVAGVAVAFELPTLLLGLPAGAMADQVDRKRLAVSAAFVQGTLIVGLGIAVATGHATLLVLYAAASTSGAVGAFAGAALRTMTPMLVEANDLERANGRLITAGAACSELAGPPLGSYLFSAAAAVPFLLSAATTTGAALLLRALPDRFAAAKGERPTTIRTAFLDIADGVRWLLRHPRLRAITLLSIVFAVTDSAWFALMALYVTQILHLPASTYGVVVGIGAAGGLVGGLIASRLAGVVPLHMLLPGLLAAATAGQIVLAIATRPVVATAALSASSFAFGVWDVVTLTQFQRLTPTRLLGRVMAADRTVINGASPLGALLGGIVATALGLRAPFVLGSPVLVVATVTGYLLLRTSRVDGTAPATSPAAPLASE